MPNSQFTLPVFEAFRGGRTTSKDATYLRRFGEVFTLQVVYSTVIGGRQNEPVLQLLSEVHM